MIIDLIDNPSDLKNLTIEQLQCLSEEIRSMIIDVISVNGGHLASNLGSVELITSIHYYFNSPIDKIIFDTSHQTYAHKILTGRKSTFYTIRKFKGLSGFSSPQESVHDHFYAGHAGTALSLALGAAKGRDLNKSTEYIIPFIGDASLSCGLTLEALNNINKDTKKFIVVLNDNAMFISDSVGNIDGNILRKSKDDASLFFNKFNLNYIGPIDGHNVMAIVEGLKIAANSDKPTLVHVLTNKGMGVMQALKNPTTYHSIKKFDVKSDKFHQSKSDKDTFPKIFGKWITNAGEKNDSIVVITPAMLQSSSLNGFMDKFKDRCIDVGIAEGHAVTFAGGLASKSNKKIFVSIYSTFLQRAFDNLFQDVLLQNSHVVFAIDRSGLSTGDGVTHHGIFDISFLNAMPNMVIAQPRNGDVLKDLLFSALSWNKSSAIRYPNIETDSTNRQPINRTIGQGEIISNGKDIVIIALGHMCELAINVKELLLAHNIQATIVDPIFIKPIDKSLLFRLMLDHKYFVTIEEHSITCGLGSIINSFIAQSGFSNIQIQNFGIPDQFIEHGSYAEVMNSIGLTAEVIANQIIQRFDFTHKLYVSHIPHQNF